MASAEARYLHLPPPKEEGKLCPSRTFRYRSRSDLTTRRIVRRWRSAATRHSAEVSNFSGFSRGAVGVRRRTRVANGYSRRAALGGHGYPDARVHTHVHIHTKHPPRARFLPSVRYRKSPHLARITSSTSPERIAVARRTTDCASAERRLLGSSRRRAKKEGSTPRDGGEARKR